MDYLVYYTIGYNIQYLDILELSIHTLRMFQPSIDVLVLCDASMEAECRRRIPHIYIKTFENSKTPQASSMQKLKVFEWDGIYKYKKVLFIDSDIIIHRELNNIFNGIINEERLYVYTENIDLNNHNNIWWSLQKYTPEILEFFKYHNIFPFNAGCFGFVVNNIMKHHFDNVNTMIQNHVGDYFYEQSFMNVYFNTKNITDRSVLTNGTYEMFVKPNNNYNGKIVHFCGDPRDGSTKLNRMKMYYNSFINIRSKIPYLRRYKNQYS